MTKDSDQTAGTPPEQSGGPARSAERIRLPRDPEALRLLEAREESDEGGESACMLGRVVDFAAAEDSEESAD